MGALESAFAIEAALRALPGALGGATFSLLVLEMTVALKERLPDMLSRGRCVVVGNRNRGVASWNASEVELVVMGFRDVRKETESTRNKQLKLRLYTRKACVNSSLEVVHKPLM